LSRRQLSEGVNVTLVDAICAPLSLSMVMDTRSPCVIVTACNTLVIDDFAQASSRSPPRRARRATADRAIEHHVPADGRGIAAEALDPAGLGAPEARLRQRRRRRR
jgi:hypothetical protein